MTDCLEYGHQTKKMLCLVSGIEIRSLDDDSNRSTGPIVFLSQLVGSRPQLETSRS
jgi:hypothetical protein